MEHDRSSNVNEVIRAVLNSLFFSFYEKISHAPKVPKAPKTQTHNQAKAQNAKTNKNKNALKTSKGKKVTYSVICVFVLFVLTKKRK